jgi:hypothetical protein
MVCDYEEACRFEDPEGWLQEDDEGYGYLVDTEVGLIVFCDRVIEFEDTTLDRGLQPLVRYMEEVAK